MAHFVYIVHCADNTLYTGYTTDVEKRIKEHNADKGVAAARYTRSRRPVKLVYQETLATRGEALSREYAIKRFTRAQKNALIKTHR